MASKVSWPTITCSACHCVNGGRPCDICVHFNFNCRGTCPCCAKNRRAAPSTSKGLGTPSVTKQGPESACTECDCLKTSMPCRKCIRVNLKCAGNCACCARSQKPKITIDEKVLDNIIRNSVITPIKCNNKPVLLLSWETYNKLSKPSAQQPPAPKKVVKKPPSRAVSTLPNKNMRSVLCTQCFCEADEIPCEICSFKDTYCRGSCPCCNKKAKQKILDPHAKSAYDPICPRCTRTPGEGLCHFCRKTSEESAEALARLKARKIRRSKPAILQHRKKNWGNSSTEKVIKVEKAAAVIKVEKAAVSKVENQTKQKESNSQDPSHILDEYCLHCQCLRGSEPCTICNSSICYGECICCKRPKGQKVEKKVQENKAAVLARKRAEFLEKFAADDLPINSQASTSGARANHSSVPNTKCERCDCYRNYSPCDVCSDNDMGCIFTGDSKLCLCCIIKLVGF